MEGLHSEATQENGLEIAKDFMHISKPQNNPDINLLSAVTDSKFIVKLIYLHKVENHIIKKIDQILSKMWANISADRIHRRCYASEDNSTSLVAKEAS